MKNIKHIFFDLDNTLWDFDTNSQEALLELFNKHSIEIKCNTTFQYFLTTYQHINHQLWQLLITNQTTKEELRYQRFYRTFSFFGYDDVILSKIWADEYLKISPYKTHLMDGTVEVLNYLKSKCQLHIITNGFKEVQHIKLNCCELNSYFNHIIISEEHGFNKPHIQIFEIAEILAFAKKNECVMIGDNFETDIQGSLSANWHAIYLSNTKPKKNAHSLTHITQLKELMDMF